jgi:type IV secretory pathway component VirB8
MEMFIRQYVITRNVILDDELEMQSRWFAGGLVNYLSSPAVFTEFESKEVKVNLPLYARNHLVRDVEINSLTREGGEKSRAWRVKFTTYDISSQTREAGGGRVIVRHWTASLQAVFVPERMFLSRRLINPLGFTVIHYSQSEER